MTVHRIQIPDPFAGGELRSVSWDDEAGEVGGDHSDVPELRRTLDRAERDGMLPAMSGHWPLRNPRRDPADFLAVLFWPGGQPPAGTVLPPALRVDPAPFVPADIPDGAVA